MPKSLFFSKYQGAGNDFVMIDDMTKSLTLSQDNIRHLCDRRFGVGSDGLIIIRPSHIGDFKMHYYNSDGSEASFCGNGGRCVALFARHRGISGEIVRFEAYDGLHEAIVSDTDENEASVKLSMNNVSITKVTPHVMMLDTGSPHYVIMSDNIDNIDVKVEGARIRYDKTISTHGVNVDFVQWDGTTLKIRTYERGVEDETLACGTGVTAAAIAIAAWYNVNNIAVEARGGLLSVEFQRQGLDFYDIRLLGPARRVFDGNYKIQ